MRWLGLVLALGLVTSSADAQVFKPKSKTSAKSAPAKSDKSDTPAKKTTAKKSARTSPSKKRVTKKKSAARSDDQASESTSKESDKDFVQITDDDVVE